MALITSGDLTLLRDSHPHAANFYLSVFVPEVVYVGTITGDPNRGDRVLTVVDVSGDISNIEEGMTIIVGTTSGDDDVARRRFRSRSGQDLTIDENSNVWANGQYVTVLRTWELWPKFPYIETTSPYTFYKDRDIAYSDQNEEPPPVAIAGEHRAKWIVGGAATFPLDASDSYTMAPSATISSYLWECDDGTIASASSATTSITFTTPNKDGYIVKLTVTDSNGKTQTTRRVLFVHDSDSHAPYTDFTVSNMKGDWEQGSWRATFAVTGDAPVTVIPNRSLVVLWADHYFDGSKTVPSVGSEVIYTGYIRSESISTGREDEEGRVLFQTTSITDMLRRHNMFSVSLVDATSPSTWWQYKNLTVPRAVHHLWKWHSTLFEIADVFLPSSSIRLYAVDDFVNGNLYSLVDTFAYQHGIFAHTACDRLGRVRMEIDVQYLNDAGRDAIDEMMTVTIEDYVGEVEVRLVREEEKRTSFVMLSGTSYDGTDTTPYIAKSPGEVPDTEGTSTINVERQVLSNQTDANERVGRVQAVENNVVKDLTAEMAGNYSFIDVVPQYWYNFNLPAADNKRDVVLEDRRCLVREVSVDIDILAGTFSIQVTFQPEANGDDGIAGEFPTEPDTIWPDPPPPLIGSRLIAFDDNDGAHVLGSWTQRVGALSGANIQDQDGGFDPYWLSKSASNDRANVILWKCNVGKIYRSTNQGVSWTDVTPSLTLDNPNSESPAPTIADVTLIRFSPSLFETEKHLFIGRWQGGSGDWNSWIFMTDDDGASWSHQYIATSARSPSFTKVDDDTVTLQDLDAAGIVKLDDTYFMVWHAGDSGGTKAVGIAVYSVDGSFNLTLEDTWFWDDDNFDWPQSYNGIDLVKLSSTRVLIVSNDGGTNGTLVAGTVDWDSGTGTISGNGITEIDSDNQLYTPCIVPVDANNAYVMYNKEATNEIGWQAITINASGVVTGGTVNTVSTSAFIGPREFSAAQYDSQYTLVSWYENSDIYMQLFNHLTGSWVGTKQVMVVSVSPSYQPSKYPLGQIAGYQISKALSSTLAVRVVPWSDGFDTYVDIYPIIRSGSSISVGTRELVSDADTSLDMTIDNNGTELVLSGEGSIQGNISTAYADGNTIVWDDNETGVPIILGNGDTGARGICYWDSSHIIVANTDDNSQITVYTYSLSGVGSSGGEVKALDMDVDRGDGESVWITIWDGSAIQLIEYSIQPSLSFIRAISLGSASESEISNGEYDAHPLTFPGIVDTIYVFGRMNDPQSLGNPVHIIGSTDGGTTWGIFEDGWGADACGALFYGFDGRFNAIRNHYNGNGSRFYRGLAALTEQSSLTFKVNPKALIVSPAKIVVVGSRTGGSVKLMYTAYPFTTWTDITQDFPTTGGIVRLILV